MFSFKIKGVRIIEITTATISFCKMALSASEYFVKSAKTTKANSQIAI
jgi:hypothetical protein